MLTIGMVAKFVIHLKNQLLSKHSRESQFKRQLINSSFNRKKIKQQNDTRDRKTVKPVTTRANGRARHENRNKRP